jgi:penicillin-binding protein 1A
MGYGEPRSLGDRETGGRLVLPIWIDFMGSALKGVPVAALKAPPGLAQSGEFRCMRSCSRAAGSSTSRRTPV